MVQRVIGTSTSTCHARVSMYACEGGQASRCCFKKKRPSIATFVYV